MKNCLTMVLYAKFRLKKGKIVIMSWSGAWRKQEWPKIPHFALKINNCYIHYDADNKKLSLWKILNFSGKFKRKHIKKRSIYG